MKKVNFYNIPDKDKKVIFSDISSKTGLPAYAVEKDWWVVQVLSAIFNMDAGKFMVFKGGTSLSKAWKLIDRFSEDVDLAFDREFLDIENNLTRSGIKSMRKKSGKFISETFSPELETILKKTGLTGITLNYVVPENSDADPAQIEIFYPNVIAYPEYIKPRILLEISCSSLKEPNAVQSLSSLIGEFFPDSPFDEKQIDIPTAIPERTFLEKIFLLHEEFHRPHEKIRIDRLSRHLYDIYQLIKTDFAEKAINNSKLYENIVYHRYNHNRIGGIDYNLHQPQTINPLPIPQFIDAWKADYKTMQEQMIYGDSPSFDEIIKTIKNFTVNKINRIEWKMEVEFLKPKIQTEKE